MKRILLLLLSVLISAHVFSQDSPKAYLVSNAHFDSQWNWDVQRSIREYIPKTLDQNLFLLGAYPDYVFNFEGGIKYQWMKEYYPHQYELIKRYIREGRWHVTGSTWDATDPNIPSAESFTRNILYGQHFYRREFGGRRHGHLPSGLLRFRVDASDDRRTQRPYRLLDAETHVAPPPVPRREQDSVRDRLVAGRGRFAYHGRDGRPQLYDQVALRRPQP